MGLRSRPWSALFAGGERDLRSNRERRGSGSVWSKRERFAVRRSVSSIVAYITSGVKENGYEVSDGRQWKMWRIRQKLQEKEIVDEAIDDECCVGSGNE